jgi:hypothetical protein
MKATKRKPHSNLKNEWESVTPDTIDDLEQQRGDHQGLTSSEATVLLKIHGKNELPVKTIPKWSLFI